MNCIWGYRPSLSVDGWRMFSNDDQMVSGDKCGLNFLTYVLQLRENLGKNLNQKTDLTRIWTWARWRQQCYPSATAAVKRVAFIGKNIFQNYCISIFVHVLKYNVFSHMKKTWHIEHSCTVFVFAVKQLRISSNNLQKLLFDLICWLLSCFFLSTTSFFRLVQYKINKSLTN